MLNGGEVFKLPCLSYEILSGAAMYINGSCQSGRESAFAKWLRDSDSMVFSAGHVPTIFFSSVVASDLPLLKRHNSRPQKARHPARRHRARHRAIILRRFQPTKRPLIQEATAIMATILMVLSSQWRGHNL